MAGKFYISPGFSNGVGHEVKSSVVTHDRAGIKPLQFERLVVELSSRLRVRLDEHLENMGVSRHTKKKWGGGCYNWLFFGHSDTIRSNQCVKPKHRGLNAT